MGGSLHCGVLGSGQGKAVLLRQPETLRQRTQGITQEAEHVLPWILELRARMAGDQVTVERDRARGLSQECSSEGPPK